MGVLSWHEMRDWGDDAEPSFARQVRSQDQAGKSWEAQWRNLLRYGQEDPNSGNVVVERGRDTRSDQAVRSDATWINASPDLTGRYATTGPARSGAEPRAYVSRPQPVRAAPVEPSASTRDSISSSTVPGQAVTSVWDTLKSALWPTSQPPSRPSQSRPTQSPSQPSGARPVPSVLDMVQSAGRVGATRMQTFDQVRNVANAKRLAAQRQRAADAILAAQAQAARTARAQTIAVQAAIKAQSAAQAAEQQRQFMLDVAAGRRAVSTPVAPAAPSQSDVLSQLVQQRLQYQEQQRQEQAQRAAAEQRAAAQREADAIAYLAQAEARNLTQQALQATQPQVRYDYSALFAPAAVAQQPGLKIGPTVQATYARQATQGVQAGGRSLTPTTFVRTGTSGLGWWFSRQSADLDAGICGLGWAGRQRADLDAGLF